MASFEKIDYSNRPSKQIERKIFIHLFFLLSNLQYSIKNYKYVGLGSIHYVDHILFHKYLDIKKMVCIEREPIPKRMKFNKPYDFLELIIDEYSNYIPKINNRNKYIIWMDFDSILSNDLLDDVGNTIGVVPNESIVLVTVNAERPSYAMTQATDPNEDLLEKIKDDLKREFGNYLTVLEKEKYSSKNFPDVIISILIEKVKDTMVSGPDDDFFQFVNYRYKDGATMITLGWIIDTKERIALLANSDFANDPYVITQERPFNITVPPLTSKEKLYLDSRSKKLIADMENGRQLNINFELKDSELQNYLNVYKYYPEFKDSFL